MNVSDIELFKKSKIIEIGSVEKKLQLHKVGGFSKKNRKYRNFVPKIWHSEPKTVPPVTIILKTSETGKSLLY